jgi:signal transduction histidine kinase
MTPRGETKALAKDLLLVDDQPQNLALLEALLRPLGHRLYGAANGEAAVELIDQQSFDLVLCDLVMPKMDGLAVLAHLRRRERGTHIPVILITGHSERDYRVRGLEAGADEFLEKPVDRPVLLARVRTLLQLKESRDEIRRSRDELAQRNAMLELSQRKQRELTQFIVHDLKNPLAVVAANLHWARENLPGRGRTELGDALAEADQAAGRMRTMIEDLLSIERAADVDIPVRRELLSVDDLFVPMIERYQRKARDKGVSLIAPTETGCTVYADAALLQRVLENILDNALRYTPPKGRIALSALSRGVVEIVVSNTGPAISPAEREQIFEKFVRGADQAPDSGNSGLGLYFCKRVIEAQGGTISVIEMPEWPTAFIIELPARP